VSIAFPDGSRAMLLDDDLETVRADGSKEKRTIAASERPSLLTEVFRLPALM